MAASLRCRATPPSATWPYGASKGALDRIVLSAARELVGRVGRPDDTAALVSFLCSADGGLVNGQLLYSDGGLHP